MEPEGIRKVYDLGGGNSVEITDKDLKGITPQASKTMITNSSQAKRRSTGSVEEALLSSGRTRSGPKLSGCFNPVSGNPRRSESVTLRSVSRSLAAIWPLEDGLVLSTMLYEDEIRDRVKIDAPLHPSLSPVSDADLYVSIN